MRIFSDRPEGLPADRVVRDPDQADVFVLFAPAAARAYAAWGKPTYLVATRMPLSLADGTGGLRLVRPAELDRLLGESGEVEEVAPASAPAIISNVIVSYSPGTNVGKTFIASNMAAWLALNGRPSVLLDLDMEGSGTWEMLGLKGARGTAPAVGDWNGDPDSLRRVLERGRHPTFEGMYLVKRGAGTSAAQVVRAVRVLSAQGFTVVVDTSNNQEVSYISAVLRTAEKVFLVATLTLKVQTRLAEMYATAGTAGGLGRMVLCVNRVGSGEEEKGLRPADLARQFMLGRHYVVRENVRGRQAALRKGTFLVALKPHLGRDLAAMCESEFGQGAAEKGRRGKPGFFALRKAMV